MPSRRTTRWAQRENERRLARHRAALHAWAADDGALCDLLERARTPLPDDTPAGFPLHPSERVVHALRASLVGCPAMPSGAGGWSFRAARRGYPPAVVEPLRALDAGTAVVTTQRVVFLGATVQQEWRYDRLVAYVHAQGAPYTALKVRDRKQVTGVLYAADDATCAHFAIGLALAYYGGTVAEFVRSLAEERAASHASRPGDPPPVSADDAPRRLLPARRGR